MFKPHTGAKTSILFLQKWDDRLCPEKDDYPIISKSKQIEIKKKILESFDAKASSKRILDIAKRGVEMAIEKNEKDVQVWIGVKLKKLGVRLN